MDDDAKKININTVNNDGADNDAPVDEPGLTNDDMAAIENMTDDELLDAFVGQMMTDKGLSDLDEITFNTLKDDLKERVRFQINRAIVAQLPQEKLDQLGASLDDDTATPDSVNDLIAGENIDVSKTVQDTMLTFRDAYLGTEKAEA